MDNKKILLIADGQSKWQRFIKHWGISFLIGEDILFDTFGLSKVLQDNIKKYKVDVLKIKKVIISHDHWDHIDGLWDIIKNRKDIYVYVCSKSSESFKKKIKSFGVKLIEITGFSCIADNVFLTGELKTEYNGVVLYEQVLVLKTSQGLVVITGCAHPGLLNIVKEIRKKFTDNIKFLVGGFHLKEYSEEAVCGVTDELKKMGVDNIVPLHCTGKNAIKIINREFKDKCVNLKCGEYF